MTKATLVTDGARHRPRVRHWPFVARRDRAPRQDVPSPYQSVRA